MRKALLVPGDLPGFQSSSQSNEPGAATAQCPALDDDFSAGATATAEALFKRAETGPFIRERLRQLSLARAQTAVTKVRGMANRCPHFSGSDPTLGDVDFTLTALGVPSIGDGAAAFRITMKPKIVTATVYENVMIVRRSGTVILITHTDINTIDNGLTSSCTSKAYEKTKRVW